MSLSGSQVAVPALVRGAAPPVSLAMPVYNGGTMMIQALESVAAQTYTDYELVVSDNASTDDTQDVMREYARRDPRIRYFRQPYNIGSGNNWTFVASQCRATWTKWISANDDYAPRLVEATLAPMVEDPRLVVCYPRTRFIDLEGNKLDVYGGDFDALADDPLERYRLVRERLHLGTAIQAGMIRSDALRRCGYLGNFPDSDRVLIAGLSLAGKFLLLQEILFYRRWDKSVASGLRGPLELRRLYHPTATRPAHFPHLPRQLGQLRMALVVPTTLTGKGRALTAAIRYTDWRRKFSGSHAPAAAQRAGD